MDCAISTSSATEEFSFTVSSVFDDNEDFSITNVEYDDISVRHVKEAFASAHSISLEHIDTVEFDCDCCCSPPLEDFVRIGCINLVRLTSDLESAFARPTYFRFSIRLVNGAHPCSKDGCDSMYCAECEPELGAAPLRECFRYFKNVAEDREYMYMPSAGSDAVSTLQELRQAVGAAVPEIYSLGKLIYLFRDIAGISAEKARKTYVKRANAAKKISVYALCVHIRLSHRAADMVEEATTPHPDIFADPSALAACRLADERNSTMCTDFYLDDLEPDAIAAYEVVSNLSMDEIVSAVLAAAACIARMRRNATVPANKSGMWFIWPTVRATADSDVELAEYVASVAEFCMKGEGSRFRAEEEDEEDDDLSEEEEDVFETRRKRAQIAWTLCANTEWGGGE